MVKGDDKMTKQNKAYEMKNYGKSSTFASFLPGISGVKGIPIWCYYVNRGQGVVSFGVDNKDHAIMEFYPAHQAYQNVKRTGFRTFLRKNGIYFEPFSDEEQKHKMCICMNELEIEEMNKEQQIKTTVGYYTLPGEKIGALVRKVTIKNMSHKIIDLEIIDGMPAVIPYGVNMDSIKMMGQTTKAWMQVEDVDKNVPYYRVRISMDDSATVKEIKGGNFSAGHLEDGTVLSPIVDPDVIFSYDNSLTKAVTFAEDGLNAVYNIKQITQNTFPCSFYGTQKKLGGQEEITIYEIVGQVEEKKILEEFFEDKKDARYFETKRQEANELVTGICKGIETKTASKEFDAYCQYTYLDNVLRGGYPIKLGNNKIFYVYSRKHGDLERDYNYFSMLPEYYSQGNGNFRDVSQNRRCDTFFAPFVERENIQTFYSLIQMDGYNPLGVEKITYQMGKSKAQNLFAELSEKQAKELTAFVAKPFTPGAIYSKLESVLADGFQETWFYQIIDFSESTVNGNFGEGYWSDHWTYNLDLIENYLEVNPEKEEEMLYEESYTYFLAQINVNRRNKRYQVTSAGLRQYHALNEKSRRYTTEKLVRANYGKGEVQKGSLIEKLLLLCAIKFATLDAYGMGIEMEGGKPGWYDALNGMPGMFGSSMAETYELERMMEYTIVALEKYPKEVKVFEELGCLMDDLYLINRLEQQSLFEDEEVLSFWNQVNDRKEIYRDKTYAGISGKKVTYKSKDLLEMLMLWQMTVRHGIEKACKISGKICPTYFTYEVTKYNESEDGICPLEFKVQTVPYFLEGPVRYLKLEMKIKKKQELYHNIKNSDLYDKKLSMYKVNASLQNVSLEIGRARAFTPGWLENESIWLHMEYKYLLELLKSEMYEAFFEDFHRAAVPFLDPVVYGRSIYENSSFIASSKNSNAHYHGKGFVARLSGSTIEFISMWKLMMFGKQLFMVKKEELVFAPTPAIPSYLIPEDKTVRTTLLGDIKVLYSFAEKKNYIPGTYEVKQMKFEYKNGTIADTQQSSVSGKIAKDIREKRVASIEIVCR